MIIYIGSVHWKSTVILTTIFNIVNNFQHFLILAHLLCQFLSDPSPIIGYACHSLTHSLTDKLTDCCLVNLIDMTLVCEDANSKLVEVVTVADVDDEDRDGNNLLQIWKLRFGHET